MTDMLKEYGWSFVLTMYSCSGKRENNQYFSPHTLKNYFRFEEISLKSLILTLKIS